MGFGGGGSGTPSPPTSPIGTVLAYAGLISKIPTNYKLCDGSAISRATFASLFTAISTLYGVGDGATTFNLPDLRAKFPRGAPAATEGGAAAGSDTVTLTALESGLRSHNHAITDPGHNHEPGTQYISATNKNIATVTSQPDTYRSTTDTTGITINNAAALAATNAHENKPAYQEIQYIIKAEFEV